ncbi:MAG: SDR family oxidoreductase [Thermoanaerobaculia bacterium]
MIDLTGLHVLVTGGSRGIGAAACRMFAQAGATVMVHYKERHAAADALLDELFAISSREHRRFPCDVAEPAEIQELFQHVGSEWGKLDCLVNNAGVWTHNPMSNFSEDRYIETMRVNVRGPFFCVREALPFLRQSKQASIINLSSTAGQRGEPFYSPYAASKGALISATKAWATELAPEIRVNCVAPGWVDTDMSADPLSGESREEIEAGIPLRRVASAEDVAGPIVFLASELARQITGEILNVNGGAVLVG